MGCWIDDSAVVSNAVGSLRPRFLWFEGFRKAIEMLFEGEGGEWMGVTHNLKYHDRHLHPKKRWR